ncbi:Spc24-domain-containing protein [Dissoconium aciculare CBS 342.82]|uniref:Kinetochore protein Spc24 n=1 Tax=Dissoconium aciculare CBS 342.82 TaxID=1314786 RepID=A0A6J3M8V1_9PEZI|nr:Spc24-domain-containing protein [Dissoconium aciculare CBS 342.82]KAF1823262.1 Spc24-domain-containing protein [Dissoconium aciculare CBS 342.82]
MVLFDEDPVTLISATTEQFKIAPDKDSLTRISDSLHSLGSTRQMRIDAQSQILSTLSRKLNNLKGQYDYEEERHDAGRHAAEMLKMDTEKFRIAKGANDAEIESERLSGELAALKLQLSTLEKEGVEGASRRGEDEVDEVVLKLQFFRSLGIDATQDPKTGEYTRAIIRNSNRGDVNVVNVDGKMSPNFTANMFWDAL